MQQALELVTGGREILGRPWDMSRPWGLFVQKDGFQGWGGLSAGRREALARAVQHGEHDVPVYLPSRVVTIDGWAIADTPHNLQRRLEDVTGIGATGAAEDFSAKQWGLARHASGRRILAVADDEGRWKGRHIYTPFQLQFVFADPRKYGETTLLPGDKLTPPSPSATATSIDVYHRGNFPAYPLIEIPNASASYSVTSPGGTFTVTGATAGGTHVVDLRRGRVYRNGVEMPGAGRGDLWAVPAHTSWTHALSIAGRIHITDTFV
ncbi:hypothetical protein RU09_06070 [Microbacterium sp. MEJ108Y]|uniref:hypothetical protein n=1 Tax=Microbacterium sp. MEJ108Y TaxID=1587523 RepID=UPI0005AC7411|nr:hypothetical protein [Microbacterium sp. MEJ108Y]KIP93377.1 hypothetical protein RU09_06070 [Microbacterium sp. MEJ108Y]